MKTQTKLVLGLLLAQAAYISANCDVKLKKLPIETLFNKKVSVIAKTRKLDFGEKPIDQLSVKEKEAVLTAIIENLFDKEHKDNFASHAEFIAYVFDHKNVKTEHTTKEYQELAKFLRENKNCKSIFVFLGTVLPELQKKAPKEITKKVAKVVEEKGRFEVSKVLASKLR